MRRILEWFLNAYDIGKRLSTLEDATKDTIKSFVFLMGKQGISPKEYVIGREENIEDKNSFMTECSKSYLMLRLQSSDNEDEKAAIMRQIQRLNTGEIQIDLSREE